MTTTKETHTLDFRTGPLAGVRMEWNGKTGRLLVMPVPGDSKVSRKGLDLLGFAMFDEEGVGCKVQLACVVKASTMALNGPPPF